MLGPTLGSRAQFPSIVSLAQALLSPFDQSDGCPSTGQNLFTLRPDHLSTASGRVHWRQEPSRRRLEWKTNARVFLTTVCRLSGIVASGDDVSAIHVVQSRQVGEGRRPVERHVGLQDAAPFLLRLVFKQLQSLILLALLTDVTSNIRRKFSKGDKYVRKLWVLFIILKHQ